ncbi:helicase associated domain-containing protein [Tunicatimonas pelagia]|uniref:helicase associated domain-containing protein n=1 Tax=Tunicatimonas pelagia TaxID=931531 RepID=UPI0026652D0B|nr:helicase associated domain-containing protein [Tunicatimonas pelagia]WKN46488.1 helicase associated domain-containing protein [Tunicatimonas pelagia]
MNSGSKNELCDLFERFYQKYHHAYVPNYPEFKRLYTLVTQARKHPHRLSEFEKHCLDRRNFDWKAGNRFSRWMFNYSALKQFFEEHGHSDLPEDYPINQRLGSWAYRQRGQKDKLSPQQVAMLDDLNFTWIDSVDGPRSPNLQRRWEGMYKRLSQYKAEHGHVLVPSTYSDTQLAQWVFRQRKFADRLSSEQVDRLESLGFVFDMQLQKDLTWEYNYQQLTQFYHEHGHSRVPQTYPNRRLADWVRSQRAQRVKLTKDKLDKLSKVDFAFNSNLKSLRDQQWMDNFRQVEAFYKEHGNLSITHDKRLYRWIYKQKAKRPKEEYRRVLLRQLDIHHEG